MAVSKGFKWTAGIIAALIVIIVAGYFILENYLENRIHTQLTERLLPEHQVSVNEVDVDLLYGDLIIDSLRISADSNLQSKSGIVVYQGNIDELHVSGIKVLELLFNNKLIIGKFELSKADVRMEMQETSKDTAKKKKELPVNEVLIKDIEFDRINFRLLSEDKDGKPRLAVDSFNLLAEMIKFNLKDSLTYNLPLIRRINADNFSSFIAKDFYEIAVKQIRWHNDSSLLLRNLQIVPQYKKYEFSRKLGHQTDRIDIKVDSILIEGIDYGKIPDEIFHVRQLYLGDGFAELFRDKRIARPEGYVPPLPQQALRRLKSKVLIDTIHIKHGELHYYEMVEGAPHPGHVYFTDLNMLFLNVNNDPEAFDVRNELDFYATGAVMGQSLAQVHWWFPVHSPNDTMFFSGSFNDFDLEHLNEITMPNEKVKIDRGRLNKLQFEAQTNAKVSSGELIFLYDNLKMSIFKKDEKLIEEQTIVSFLANTFLRTNNPPPGRNPLLAKMSFERDMEKSSINFLWKSIFSGIKYTVTPGKDNLERIKDAEDYFSK